MTLFLRIAGFMYSSVSLSKNRIHLERVSPKWKALMPYSDITSVYFNNFVGPQGKLFSETYKGSSLHEDFLIQVLKATLKRAGQYLHKLDFKIKKNECFVLIKEFAELIVTKAPNLTVLNLTKSVLTMGSILTLSNLSKLEELRLTAVLFIEEDLSSTIQDKETLKSTVAEAIKNLSSLKKLALPIDFEFSPLMVKSSYIELAFGGGKITSGDMRAVVQQCQNLDILSFHFFGNPVDLQLSVLGGLKKLKNLELFSEILSDGDFAAICIGCPNLEILHVHVDSCKNLHNCSDLWRLPNLKSLWIMADFEISPVDDAVLAAVANYGLLEDVRLPWSKLTDEGLKNLASNCPKLVKLCISRIETISDEGVKAVLEKCKNLQELDIAWTLVGDATLGAIGKMGYNLRTDNFKENT